MLIATAGAEGFFARNADTTCVRLDHQVTTTAGTTIHATVTTAEADLDTLVRAVTEVTR